MSEDESLLSPQLLKTIEGAVVSVISKIPSSSEKARADVKGAAGMFTGEAAREAALITGALSLAPGPAGMLTLVPDLVGVWRRQARLVADIAAVSGKSDELTKELMMYCLYRHVDRRTMAKLLVRGGEGVLVGRAMKRAMHDALSVLTGRLVKRVVARAAARWVPFVGAGALAAYSYRDTKEVGKTALEVFTTWGDGSKPRKKAKKKARKSPLKKPRPRRKR
jgi:hypothetical protein